MGQTAGGVLAVVADGLGGQAFGELASRAATETVCAVLAEAPFGEDSAEEAVCAAEQRILDLQRDHPGAMTTLALLWLQGDQALAVHIGDTRIYLFREGQILYQSVDHSESQLAVFAGEITRDEIRGHPARNRLTRALGAGEEYGVTIRTLRMQSGDRALLCSDGFWEAVWEEQMLQTAEETTNTADWLRRMRETAETSAKDNNTAIAWIAR